MGAIKTYTLDLLGAEGQTSVGSHTLIKRKPIVIEKEGLSHDIKLGIASTPGNRQAVYIGFLGVIKFAQPFAPGGEQIKVWYKT